MTSDAALWQLLGGLALFGALLIGVLGGATLQQARISARGWWALGIGLALFVLLFFVTGGGW